MANSTTQETVRLLIEAKGINVVNDLQRQLDLTKGSIEALKDAFVNTGAVTMPQFKANAASLSRQAKQLAEEVKEAKRQIEGLGGNLDVKGVNTAIRNIGFGISDVFSNNGPLGQKVQGFANNVGNIATGVIGAFTKIGPAGLAVAAGLEIAFTLAGAAMSAFGVKSLEDLKNLFTGGSKIIQDELKQLEGRIKTLSEKPYKIDVEIYELTVALERANKLKAALEAIEAIKSSQTTFEHKSGQEVEGVIRNAKDDKGQVIGAQGVQKRLVKPILAALNKPVDEEEKAAEPALLAQIDSMEKYIASGDDEAGGGLLLLREAKEKLDEVRKKASTQRQLNQEKIAPQILGDIVATAEKGHGDEQKHAQEELVKRLRAAGLHKVASGIDLHSPKYEEDAEEAKENIKDSTEVAEFKERQRKAEETAATKKHNEEKAALSSAISETNALGTTEDLRKEAKEGLVDGENPEKIKEKIKTKLLEQLKTVNKVPEAIREAVAETISKSAVEGVGEKEIEHARELEGTKEERALKREETETRRTKAPQIKAAVAAYGPSFGKSYEVQTADNAAAIASGAPIATSAKQEKRFVNSGQNYALPPDVLQKRLQQQMFNQMTRNGASDDVAKTATRDITTKGDTDLAKRSAAASQSGLSANQAALQVVQQLSQEMQQVNAKNNYLLQQWQALSKQNAANQRTVQNRGNR